MFTWLNEQQQRIEEQNIHTYVCKLHYRTRNKRNRLTVSKTNVPKHLFFFSFWEGKSTVIIISIITTITFWGARDILSLGIKGTSLINKIKLKINCRAGKIYLIASCDFTPGWQCFSIFASITRPQRRSTEVLGMWSQNADPWLCDFKKYTW